MVYRQGLGSQSSRPGCLLARTWEYHATCQHKLPDKDTHRVDRMRTGRARRAAGRLECPSALSSIAPESGCTTHQIGTRQYEPGV
eukprot:1711749-Rhodomonas_salina.2